MRVIAGSARSLRLKTPKGNEVRPTTDRIKETLFNIISPGLYDCFFLDLFCGSGGIGIEALSRGASHAVFVDESRTSLDCTLDNLNFTRLADRAELMRMNAVDAVNMLRLMKQSFDIIFMDPPYDKELEKTVLEQKAFYDILNEEGFVIVEASAATSFDYAESIGFEVFREKSYGSNKHIFLRKKNEA